MHAYANPDSPSNGAGYGLIRFQKKEKEIKKLNTKVSSLEKGYKSKVSDLNESKA